MASRSARWSASSASRRSRSSSVSNTPTTSASGCSRSHSRRWGPLDDDEVLRFFSDVCGTFPDSRFLHYNLPRTKRVLGGRDYAKIIPVVPNFVATKTTGGGMAAAEELIRHAGELQHFMGEGNFPHGAMFGEASLLASYAELSPRMTYALFEAGRTATPAS